MLFLRNIGCERSKAEGVRNRVIIHQEYPLRAIVERFNDAAREAAASAEVILLDPPDPSATETFEVGGAIGLIDNKHFPKSEFVDRSNVRREESVQRISECLGPPEATNHDGQVNDPAWEGLRPAIVCRSRARYISGDDHVGFMNRGCGGKPAQSIPDGSVS